MLMAVETPNGNPGSTTRKNYKPDNLTESEYDKYFDAACSG
jgi:hypothetical protein